MTYVVIQLKAEQYDVSMAQAIYRAKEYLSEMHDAIMNDIRGAEDTTIEGGFGNNHNDCLSLRLRRSTIELVVNKTGPSPNIMTRSVNSGKFGIRWS